MVNDITNLILQKERVRDQENAAKLRKALIIVSIVGGLSIALNVYLLIVR